jgi:predicted ATPase
MSHGKKNVDQLGDRPKLDRITIRGWKTIRSLVDFHLDKINVLIGPNGAGKSNFISLFRMLGRDAIIQNNLQFYISKHGGANGLLHLGAASNPELTVEVRFKTTVGAYDYSVELAHAAGDTFVFAAERIRTSLSEGEELFWTALGTGHRESHLEVAAQSKGSVRTASVILAMLKACVVYQFHNTSETSRMRQRWDINDSFFLKEDAANLASFLLRLQGETPKHYGLIVDTLRQILPFFNDFELIPSGSTVLLQWREAGSDMVYGAHQASDGMLRTMALVSLLLQPPDTLPTVLILDEPELGLHPFAINTIAGLIRAVSNTSQVIVATQSTTFIDQFEPHEIVVVDRKGAVSEFKRLSSAELGEWLEDYSLSELWEKNVIGGRP